MSFEQPVYSFNHPSGEPPTPIRTPTSPNFFSNSYETPKQESRFHDPNSPWTPAFPFSPTFKDPTNPSFTPPANHESSPNVSRNPSTIGDGVVGIASDAHDRSPITNTSLPPVAKSRQLASSPNTSFAFQTIAPRPPSSGPAAAPSQLSFDQGAASSMNSAASSMQTPPPTSTSASRRKAEVAQVARSAKGSAGQEGRRMSTSAVRKGQNATSPQVEESPQFPSLLFSPEGSGYQISGPATAPVYPQSKLFWDPNQSEDAMNAMNLDFSMDDTFNSFGLGLQKPLDPFVSDHDQTTGMSFSTAPAFSGTGTTTGINIANLSAPKHSMALNQTNLSPNTAIMTQGSSRGKIAGTVVNPSLLFSSPGRAQPSSSQTVQDDTLKPYAHQLADAEIEKEMRSRRPKRKRGVELDSPAVKAATQALRGAEEESSMDSADGAVVASFGGPVRPMSRHSRKTSPHRRSPANGQEICRSLADSGKRTSVTLTVDANGRAKTKATVVDDPARSTSSGIDNDSDSTDSDSSSSRSSQGMAFSQPSSFAYPIERRKKVKSNRSHGVQSSHSHQSSYTSTLGSVNATANSNSRGVQENTNFRRPSQPQVRFEETASFVGGTLGGDDSEAETIVDTDEDNGNATSALKKVVRRRSTQKLRKSSSSGPRQSFADHRLPHNSQSGPLQPYYSQTPSRLGYPNPQQSISPTTITDPDMRTPSTGGRTALSSASITRCVCNVEDGNGQSMVQCDSCKSWLHLSCVGLNEHNVPEIYLCVFCNHDTPKVRGGRVREPARAAFPPPGSPLTYKSLHFR